MPNDRATASVDERTTFVQEPVERRKRKRLKLLQPVHVRPLRSSEQDLEEVASTADFNGYGLCFTTAQDHYEEGMSLFLKFPFSQGASAHMQYVGEVVRVEGLPAGEKIVAVKFLQFPVKLAAIERLMKLTSYNGSEADKFLFHL